MSVYKDKNNDTWYAIIRYTDWTGKVRQKLKRGFKTKREAVAWERDFIEHKTVDMNITFAAFVELYRKDMKSRLKENTWLTKEAIIEKRILPYFEDKRMCDIQPKDVISWKKEMLEYRNEKGKPYSPAYLKTLHNQLSAIFNHAKDVYELRSNPAAKVGNFKKGKSREMLFWTTEEYSKFSKSMMEKPISFIAFEILYWCGVRLGELLALTPNDFNFIRETVSINKSYQRIKGRDVITSAQNIGLKRVCFSGGEPFLHPEIARMVKYTHDKGIESYIYTSGIYLNNNIYESIPSNILKEIKDYVAKLIFNVESSQSDTYDLIMGTKGNLELLKKSVSNCVKFNIITEAHFVPMKINMNQIRSTFNMCMDLGVSRVSYLRLVIHGRAVVNKHLVALNEEEQAVIQKNLLN